MALAYNQKFKNRLPTILNCLVDLTSLGLLAVLFRLTLYLDYECLVIF